MGDLPCFDDLTALAEEDPQAFDRFRRNVCEEFINSIPAHHRRRLQGVQFRVNHEIRRAKTPLAGLIKVSGMMHDSLHELTGHLDDLRRYAFEPRDQWPRPQPREGADIVSLDSWRRQRRRRQSH